jgi:hypothetical protein
VPGPSKPETFEDCLRAFMEGRRAPYIEIGLYSRGDDIVLALPKADGEDEFSVDGNTVAPLTEPKGG